MNIFALLKVARIVFKSRKLVALAVLLELVMKKKMNSHNKHSKKRHAKKKQEYQHMFEDRMDQAQHMIHNLKKQYAKR